MNRVKIAVVEDEIIIADNICESLESLGYNVLEPAISFTEGKELIDNEQPDIVILDINLSGKKDGVDLALYIKEIYDLPFIFLTAHADKATVERAKIANPPAYLVKPFTKEELYSSIEVTLFNYQQNKIENQKSSEKQFVYIKQKNVFLKLKYEHILFLKSDHVYIEIITLQNDKYVVREGLSDFEAKLNDDFVRIHRSYVVNSKHIDLVEATSIKVQAYDLPLSKQHRPILLEKIANQ
ncbi:MAG: DNA-binding response regulator [Flavobacteriales bacterium]|nr:DNA-binding response regulator [Crocinitomicaceae bacterium]NBX79495.1 DNA-binding response regulator [Flavobacteriales bacterium]NCA20318.1 DNA-binding response regulator [Crocinitomicaceae bacterium]